MVESWSPRAKRASRSLGVIRSKPWKSRMLPQRLATWLSATRNAPGGMAAIRSGMTRRLKMPWRKALKTTAAALAAGPPQRAGGEGGDRGGDAPGAKDAGAEVTKDARARLAAGQRRLGVVEALVGTRPVVEFVPLEHAVTAADEHVLLRRRP